MNANPWQVDSIQEFAFLNCPECTFKSKHEDFFQEHATKSHPSSSVLFNTVLDEKDFIENWNGQNEYQINEEEGTTTNIQVKSEEFPLSDEHAYALTSVKGGLISESFSLLLKSLEKGAKSLT
jgi:hypothetical protein